MPFVLPTQNRLIGGITVEYTPKKVFVLENGTYLELSCTEFRRREYTYHGRRFIPLHGMLMEVPEDAYKAFYKRKRREKYLKDRSKDNGEDILVDTVADTQGQAERNLLLDKLRRALNKLSEEERTLLEQYYFTGVSECELSVIYMEGLL